MGHNIAIVAMQGDISSKRISHIRNFIAKLESTTKKMDFQFAQMVRQSFQSVSTGEFLHFACLFAERRTMILSIVGIQADIDVILPHRRHLTLIG